MDLIDYRTIEAIIVESLALKELDAQEDQETLPLNILFKDLALQLLLSTQSTLEEVPDGFQKNTLDS